MENPNLENWDEAQYKELNTYFRIKIDHLLRTNAQLQEQIEQSEQLQLKELIAHLLPEDQVRWDEFLVLDKQKLEIDMWNHLHGTGSRFRPGIGFTSATDTEW